MKNRSAAALVNLRWSRMSPAERSAAVPRNGGRKRIYEPCPRNKQGGHRFKGGVCRCGQVKLT